MSQFDKNCIYLAAWCIIILFTVLAQANGYVVRKRTIPSTTCISL